MTRQKRLADRRLRLESLEDRQLLAVVFSPPGGADGSSGAIELGPLTTQEGHELPFDIRFNFESEIRQVPSALRTMELAAQIWESYIADPVTVFIDVEFSEPAAAGQERALGLASPNTALMDYPTLRNLLVEDAVNEFIVDGSGVASLPDRSAQTASSPPIVDLDDRIVQHLPGTTQLQFNLPPDTDYLFPDAGSSASGNVNVPIGGASTAGGLLSVNRATLKSLGELSPEDPSYLEPDGRIELTDELVTLPSGQTSFLLDFDPEDGVLSDSQFDGLAVAVHEIGHILGFISSVDFFDATIEPTPMDLFRFPVGLDRLNPTENPDPTASDPFEQFESFTRELRPSLQAMTDFGTAYWTGAENPAIEVPMADVFADQQTSHWQEFGQTTDPGIMGPTLSPGVKESLTPIDLRMFDLIGWDIVSPSLTNVDVTNLYVSEAGGSIDPRANAFDVDGNGVVTPLDALMVINDLNRRGAEGESEPEQTDGAQRIATDVNQDGKVTPLDALLVINYLNRQEHESAAAAVDGVFSEQDEEDPSWIEGPQLSLF